MIRTKLCFLLFAPIFTFVQFKILASETNIFDFNTNETVYALKDKKTITGMVCAPYENGKRDFTGHVNLLK